MKLLQISCLVLLLLSSAYSLTEVGYAQILGSSFSKNVSGFAILSMVSNRRINITLVVDGLENRGTLHGIHIHEFGDLSLANGTSVGEHWNPQGAPHRCENSSRRHFGDLGNWRVDAKGSIRQTKLLRVNWRLSGNSSAIGRALVIHNKTDDCKNINSTGVRLAFGVIGIANVTGNNASQAGRFNLSTCLLYPSGKPQYVNISSGNATGGFVLFEVRNGTNITVLGAFRGLEEEDRAFHIHQFGDPRNNATNAGPHFNPDNSSQHAIPDITPRHAGDLGNIFFHPSANLSLYSHSFNSSNFSLSGVRSIIGRAVIVHEDADDCDPKNDGNAGARLYVGVCGIASKRPELLLDLIPGGNPTAIPTEQDTSECPSAQE